MSLEDPQYVVAKHWSKWIVRDVLWLNPPRVVSGPHDTREIAQQHADRLNTPAPAPARQHALFDTKEV